MVHMTFIGQVPPALPYTEETEGALGMPSLNLLRLPSVSNGRDQAQEKREQENETTGHSAGGCLTQGRAGPS